MPHGGSPLTILCPLAAERHALERSPTWQRLQGDSGTPLRVEVCGPGPRAVERWFAAARPEGRLLLLGVAGGIVVGAERGHAGFVDRVVDEAGAAIGSAEVPASWRGQRWCAASVGVPASTPDAKRALATRTGADVVDMESVAFVLAARRLAPERRIRVSIIRGISDGPDDTLPDGIERLVDERGGTRIAAAIALLARRPSLLAPLRALGRQTSAAVSAAAELIPHWLAESGADSAEVRRGRGGQP